MDIHNTRIIYVHVDVNSHELPLIYMYRTVHHKYIMSVCCNQIKLIVLLPIIKY